MSLISEALKKAQAQQQQGQPSPTPQNTAEAAQANTAPAALPSPSSERGKTASKPLVLIAIAAVALLLMTGGGLIAWGVINLANKSPEAIAIANTQSTPTSANTAAPTLSAPAPVQNNTPQNINPSPVTKEAAPAITENSSKPIAQEKASPSNASSPLTPITFKVEEPTAPAAQTQSPVASSAQTIQETPAKPAPSSIEKQLPAAAPEVAKQETTPISPSSQTPVVTAAPVAPPTQLPEIRQRVASLEIRGIMRGGGKVLLYDPEIQRSRAFSSGDYVDLDLGISISSISAHELVFLDEQGAKYIKRF